MKKIMKLISIVLTLALVLGVVGTMPAMAAVTSDGVIFSYDGNAALQNSWAAAGTGYGEITNGQAATSGKEVTDLVGKAVYGQTAATESPTNEFRYTVQGGHWSDADRANYKYLVLSCELYPDSSFAGFFWQGRSNSKISTPEKDTLNNYIKIGSWNTIMTVYEFATNGNSKNTTKPYVNGSLANVNENGGVIADTVGTTTPYDHINMHVYGTQGNSFEIDNVNY
ncbi:MAG: hypothetical protein IJ365_08195, partial [Clostridia bacterium]|nr:hypothetical protein [Clostridia bacterium]